MPSQSIRQLHFTLDSLIRLNIKPGQTLIIFVKDDTVATDTFTFEKIRCANDSIINIRYLDGHNKKVKANELWGFINDFGQCKRVYNGESYILWHRGVPNIYRKGNFNANNYYFSSSLAGKIAHLDLNNIDTIEDPAIREWLYNYYNKNAVQGKDNIALGDAISLSQDMIDLSRDITAAVFRVAFCILENYCHNH